MSELATIGARPDEILRRIEARLRSFLNLADQRCFVSEDPRNVFPPSMPDSAYIITAEGSSFNSDGDQTRDLIIETGYYNVTCFNRLSAIDESSRAASLTSVYETNLFEMKRRALLALVGWRFDTENLPPLEIASTMKATRCGRPEFLSTEDGGVHAAFLPITFSVSHSIDLCNSDYNV